MQDFSKGDSVQWNWGDGTGQGKVVERFTDRVTRTLKGSDITRNASEDEPAFLIEQDDGDQVVKSITELEPADGS